MFRRTRGCRESVLGAGSLPEMRLASLDTLSAPTSGSFFRPFSGWREAMEKPVA